MKFEQAIQAMRKKKKIKLGVYIFYIEENTIWKYRIDDDFKLLGHLSYREILSEDWEIVDEPDYQDNLFFDDKIPEETKKLKDLLKECRDKLFKEALQLDEYLLLQQIDEVLK